MKKSATKIEDEVWRLKTHVSALKLRVAELEKLAHAPIDLRPAINKILNERENEKNQYKDFGPG